MSLERIERKVDRLTLIVLGWIVAQIAFFLFFYLWRWGTTLITATVVLAVVYGVLLTPMARAAMPAIGTPLLRFHRWAIHRLKQVARSRRAKETQIP